MLNNDIRNKITEIIHGQEITWQTDNCTTARNYLCTSYSPGNTVKKDFESKLIIKKEQAGFLKTFIQKNKLWVKRPPVAEQLLTIGGEAEVYINVSDSSVIKINDAVYYATWLDFFTSLLLHNLLFEETKYQLLGFIMRDEDLQAVLKQDYIISDSPVDLNEVKSILEFNGFAHTRRNDYFNYELGLILEDIHDENVIRNSGFIFFIDTVFYVDLKN